MAIILNIRSWQELPVSFFFWSVTLFALIDWAGSWLLAGDSLSVSLVMIRLLDLAVLLCLIRFFQVFDMLGLEMPKQAEWRLFFTIAAVCLLSIGIMYALWPHWFAHIERPEWVRGIAGLFVMTLLAPVVEELFFRAVVYRMLRQLMGVIAGILLSAICFSLMHGAFAFPQLAGGVIFAVAYEWSRNLWIPILLHIGANSAVWLISL